ncbi:putative heme-binding peroxidase [Yarrowia sp. E02]|nr:putative heme-binding peroxidase [Yarrowia sp. E02]
MNYPATAEQKHRVFIIYSAYLRVQFRQSAVLAVSVRNKNYNLVRADLHDILPQKNTTVFKDGTLAPLLIRLAWHSCATYDKYTHTGGSNGATMRYHLEASDEGNVGLEVARLSLEPVKRKHPWITYADLWILAGIVSIESCNGPTIKWRDGRVDYEDDLRVPLTDDYPSEEATHLTYGPSSLGWYVNSTGQVMMPSDMSLIEDANFRFWVDQYAASEELWREHFALAFEKLTELGRN